MIVSPSGYFWNSKILKIEMFTFLHLWSVLHCLTHIKSTVYLDPARKCLQITTNKSSIFPIDYEKVLLKFQFFFTYHKTYVESFEGRALVFCLSFGSKILSKSTTTLVYIPKPLHDNGMTLILISNPFSFVPTYFSTHMIPRFLTDGKWNSYSLRQIVKYIQTIGKKTYTEFTNTL